jgi:hypothetical protein
MPEHAKFGKSLVLRHPCNAPARQACPAAAMKPLIQMKKCCARDPIEINATAVLPDT